MWVVEAGFEDRMPLAMPPAREEEQTVEVPVPKLLAAGQGHLYYQACAV